MADPSTIVDTYLTASGEPDPDRRAILIAEAFSPDAVLIDPPLTGSGHDGIDTVARTLQEQFAGHAFRRTSAVDAHHDAVRYSWELAGPDGTVAVSGMDVAILSDDGKLCRVTGFFGELTAAGSAER